MRSTDPILRLFSATKDLLPEKQLTAYQRRLDTKKKMAKAAADKAKKEAKKASLQFAEEFMIKHLINTD